MTKRLSILKQSAWSLTKRPARRVSDELRQYRLMIENIREYAVFMVDATGRVSRWNPGAERILGWREDEILGQPAAVIFTPEDRDRGVPEQEMAEAVRDGAAADERWHMRRDGSRFFAWSRMMDVRDAADTLHPHGRHVGFVKVLRDMTAERRAEAERERLAAQGSLAMQRLRRAFQQAPGFISILTGPEHRFEFVNDAHVRLFGDRALVGKTVREGFPDLAEQGIHTIMDRVYASGERFVATAMPVRFQQSPDAPPQERVLDFIFEPMRDGPNAQNPDGEVTGIFLEGYDVTARVQAERAQREIAERLEQQTRLFDGIASTTPDFIHVFDRQGRFLYANRRLLEVWGRPLHEAVGKTCLELGYERWHHEMHMREIAQVLETKRPIQGEVPFEAPVTGIFGIYEYIFSPVLGSDGKVELVAGTTRNVTDRKRAEEALKAADQRKDEFLAMLAHELRNPLSPLTNAHRLIERTESLTVRGQELLVMAERQTAQLKRLVDDLLEVSRITQGKIALQCAPVLVGTAVYQAAQSVAHDCSQRGHELAIELPSKPVQIVADAARLAQILENLLANACKYTPNGGKIAVAVAEHGAEVEIRVADNGIGIDPVKIAGLFELFHQIDATIDRAAGGLGIGLAMVKRLVELHGGTVRAESAGRGHGTTFIVRLPCTPRPD